MYKACTKKNKQLDCRWPIKSAYFLFCSEKENAKKQTINKQKLVH